MTQSKITRSQIRQWARSGTLTTERIKAIEEAHRTGQVSRDSVPAPESQPPHPPQVAGTEISARKILVRGLPWSGW